MSNIPERLHILHIVPYFNPAWAYGGPVRVAYELNRRLVERGHEVLIYTTDALDSGDRSPAGLQIVDGVKVRRFPNLSNQMAWNRLFVPMGFGRGLASLMCNFDVIHLHEFRTLQNVWALPGLRRHRLPYIVMPQGGLPPELGRTFIKYFYDTFYGRPLLRGASRLHALTEMERQQYLALGLPDSRIIIIPNGIDVTAFDREVDVAAWKRRHDIPEGKPVVLFLARLNHIKGPEFLVAAFAEVLKQEPDALLVLAGPDDGVQPEIEAQIAALGIRHAVRFTGYIGGEEDKAAAYRAADVYVLPSRYEILGITVLEALLNGTPTITTDRCGLAAQLDQDDVAEVVPFGDVMALAERILTILRHPEIFKAQAQHGREYVIRHFNWDTLTDRWVKVYRQCIAEAESKGHSRKHGGHQA
jgi:glycosyltransferase involved in cell wall biosynthesis